MPASTDFQSVELRNSPASQSPSTESATIFLGDLAGKFAISGALAAAGVRGELIKATRWRTNKNQNTKEPAELQL